jgi:hypothetical protein
MDRARARYPAPSRCPGPDLGLLGAAPGRSTSTGDRARRAGVVAVVDLSRRRRSSAAVASWVPLTEVVSRSGRNSLLPGVLAAETARAAAVTINYRH